MNYRYAASSLSLEIFDANKADLIIKVYFTAPINNESFMTYSGSMPLLRVKVMNILEDYKGNFGTVWLEAPNGIPYQGLNKIDAIGSIYTDQAKGAAGGRSSLVNCKPKTWMDANANIPWVAFSLDRNCADIGELFYIAALMDSNIFSASLIQDSKWLPKEPFTVNTTGVPRPIKMKEQAVTFASYISTQNLDAPLAKGTLTSSLSQPVIVNSLTPAICTPVVNGLNFSVTLLKSGTCTLEAYAAGTDTINPSPKVTTSFTVNPKVVYNQSFSWNEPYEVIIGDPPIDLGFTVSSNLPFTITSNTPSICAFRDASRPSLVTMISVGECSVTLRQAGTDKYLAVTSTVGFWIDPKPAPEPTPTARPIQPAPTPRPTYRPTSKPKPKPSPSKSVKTITCINGKTVKKVAGSTCPQGYKRG